MWLSFCIVIGVAGRAVGTNSSEAFPPPSPSPTGLCTNNGRRVICKHQATQIKGRNVYYQVPSGSAPSGGWPSVIIFHAWDYFAENSWDAKKGDIGGVHNKALLVMNLLKAGYAVVTPNADWNKGYWYTNEVPYGKNSPSDRTSWNASSPDHALLMQIFSQMPSWGMNVANLHCAGFSSGAYMVSRMAVSYEVCKTLSINAGSYYYCGTTAFGCPEPSAFYEQYLKAEVPTLFLQGTKDSVVPPSTQKRYYEKLQSLGVATNRILQEGADHQWIDSAPTDILNWIQKHDVGDKSSIVV